MSKSAVSRSWNKFSKQIRKISRLFLFDIYVVYEIFGRYLRRASVDRRKDLKTMQIIFRLRHLKVRPGYFFPDISSIEFVRYFCTWEYKLIQVHSFFFFFNHIGYFTSIGIIENTFIRWYHCSSNQIGFQRNQYINFYYR